LCSSSQSIILPQKSSLNEEQTVTLVLAGDIGGTKVDLALFQKSDNELVEMRHQTFPSREFSSLDAVIRNFYRNDNPLVQTACFGVAGPVFAGRCETTNLPWIIDAQELSRQFKVQSLHLLNDLEAMAYGTLTLRDDEFEVLHHGDPAPTGNRCVIAAGTGLGESILFWEGKRFLPTATEGGHSDFAPRNETELKLLNYLLEKYSRVSYERILSGPGILNLYHFFKRQGEVEPSWLKETIEQGDPASVISKEALDRRSQLCVKTLELFASIYGAEAGNFALKTKGTGGVYIGGGIGIKLLKLLREGAFLRSFFDKGRMEPLMRQMPVMVIKNERTALMGAARYAADFDFSRATR
jgi:glucokinase